MSNNENAQSEKSNEQSGAEASNGKSVADRDVSDQPVQIHVPTDNPRTNATDQREGVFIAHSTVTQTTIIGKADTFIVQEPDTPYDIRGLPNPYLGLRSFTYEDREKYAGRQPIVRATVEKITSSGDQRTLFFVTGASGSGKSSFIQAGLLPGLEAHYRQQSLDLRWAIVRPSSKPIARLITGLSQLSLPTYTLSQQSLIGMPHAFYWFISDSTPTTQINVIVIDQFEELFTQSDAVEREALLRILEESPDFEKLHTHIIAAVRSDYLPEIFTRTALYDLAKQGTDLRAISRADLREAIRRPLHMLRPEGDKRFEEALLERLADDASGDAAYLPLLQVTVEDIWNKGFLKLSNYATLTDAVQERAEEVYIYADYADTRQRQRTEADQLEIMGIFLDLVEVSLDDDMRRDVRRRRTYNELQRESNSRAGLIEDLCNARLLSKSIEARGDTDVEVVDIIHETLISNWDRLHQAIAVQRELLQQRVRIEQAANEWLAHGRSDEYLLTGIRLVEAQELTRRDDIVLRDDKVRELISHSVTQQDALRRRQVRRAYLVASVFGVLMIIALAAMLVAIIRQRVSESQRLAFAAQSELATAPETALLLAYEAISRDQNVTTERVLYEAIDQVPWDVTTLVGHTGPISSIKFSPDGQRILSAAKDGTTRLWDLNGKLITIINNHYEVWNAEFSPNGRSILTTARGKIAEMWDLNGNLLATFQDDAGIGQIVFSPDGKQVLTTSWKGAVRIWDLEGNQLASFEGHTDSISSIVFSPNGRMILTAGDYDETARLWDLDGHCLAILDDRDPKQNMVKGAIFSPDGQYILTTGGASHLWNLQGQLLATLKDGGYGSYQKAVFTPDNKYILGSDGYTPVLWDLSGNKLTEFNSHIDFINSVSLSPDGKRVLSASDDNTARLWNINGQPLAALTGHTGSVTTAIFSPDGSYILTASNDGTARLWHEANKALLAFHNPDTSRPIRRVVFSPDGRYILTGSEDGSVRLWNLSGQQITAFDGHTDSISSVAFSPDGQRILTTSKDHTAKLWDLSGRIISNLAGHLDSVNNGIFSPDGQQILTVSADHTARLWETSGRLVVEYNLDEYGGDGIAFSPDGQYILTGHGDDNVGLWDVKGHLIAILDGDLNSADSMAFSPDGQQIVTSMGRIDLWDRFGQHIIEPEGHTTWVRSAVFSSDGQYILTASQDRTARVWSRTGQPLAVLKGHTGEVGGAIFSPNGQRILTYASEDRTVRLWDLAGQLIATFNNNNDWEWFAEFSPDSEHFLTLNSDGIVRLYSTNIDELLALAACHVGRSLTTDEIARFQVPTPLNFNYNDRQCPPTFRWQK